MRRGDLRGRVAPLASTRDPLCDRMEHARVPRSRQARSYRAGTGCAVVRCPEARPTCSWRGRPLPIARPTARRPCSFVRSCHGRESNGDNEGSKRLNAGNWRHSFHCCGRYPLVYPAEYLVVISVARDLELLYSVSTERTLDLRQYQLSKASSSKKRSLKEFEHATGCVALMTTTVPANHSQGSRFGRLVRPACAGSGKHAERAWEARGLAGSMSDQKSDKYQRSAGYTATSSIWQRPGEVARPIIPKLLRPSCLWALRTFQHLTATQQQFPVAHLEQMRNTRRTLQW